MHCNARPTSESEEGLGSCIGTAVATGQHSHGCRCRIYVLDYIIHRRDSKTQKQTKVFFFFFGQKIVFGQIYFFDNNFVWVENIL